MGENFKQSVDNMVASLHSHITVSDDMHGYALIRHALDCYWGLREYHDSQAKLNFLTELSAVAQFVAESLNYTDRDIEPDASDKQQLEHIKEFLARFFLQASKMKVPPSQKGHAPDIQITVDNKLYSELFELVRDNISEANKQFIIGS